MKPKPHANVVITSPIAVKQLPSGVLERTQYTRLTRPEIEPQLYMTMLPTFGIYLTPWMLDLSTADTLPTLRDVLQELLLRDGTFFNIGLRKTRLLPFSETH